MRRFKPRLILAQWLRGRHSNIPRCCCVWFIVRYHIAPDFVLRWSLWVHDRQGFVRSAHRYVRCPACYVKNRRVEMHYCTRECQGQLGACRPWFYDEQRSKGVVREVL